MKRGDIALDRHSPARCPALLASFVTCAALLGCVDAPDPLTAVQPTPHASGGYFEVATEDEFVTVKARDVSVRAVLQEVARQSDCAIVSHEPLDERVTLDFQRLPLPEALARILRDQSFVLRASTGSPSDHRKLWVLSKGLGGEYVSHLVPPAVYFEDLDALRTEESMGSLSLALADADANVRVDAVSTLADARGDESAAGLAAAALSDGVSSVREEAVYALGEIGGAIALRALKQALLDPDDDVREAAIEAFANLGGDESAMALAVALIDSDVSVRAAAVDALGEMGGATANRLLRQALVDEESSIRESAAELLAKPSAAADASGVGS